MDLHRRHELTIGDAINVMASLPMTGALLFVLSEWSLSNIWSPCAGFGLAIDCSRSAICR